MSGVETQSEPVCAEGADGEDAPGASAYDFPVDLANLGSTYGLLAGHVPPGATVLDVGCAGGNFAAALSRERGCTVTGIDVDAGAVAAAQAQGIDAHVLDLGVATIGSLMGERRFDRIVLADVLEHLVHPQSVLGEVRGLLAEGGRVLVSLPNVSHVDVALSLLEDRFEYRAAGLLDRTHLRFFTLDSFAELASHCGFTAEAVERIELPLLGTEVLNYGREYTGERENADLLLEVARAGNPNATVYQYVLVLNAVDNPDLPRPGQRRSVVAGRRGVVVKREATACLEAERDGLQRALDNTNAELARAHAEVQRYASSRTVRSAAWVRRHGLATPMRWVGDLIDRRR